MLSTRISNSVPRRLECCLSFLVLSRWLTDPAFSKPSTMRLLFGRVKKNTANRRGRRRWRLQTARLCERLLRKTAKVAAYVYTEETFSRRQSEFGYKLLKVYRKSTGEVSIALHYILPIDFWNARDSSRVWKRDGIGSPFDVLFSLYCVAPLHKSDLISRFLLFAIYMYCWFICHRYVNKPWNLFCRRHVPVK